MQTFTTLEFAREDSIARITLDRPDAANGLDMTMAHELLRVSIECRADPGVRAVLLAARGRMFCAGGDLKNFVTHQDRLHTYVKELTTHMHAAIANFARMRAPLIVAVQGPAAGAGFSIACAADLLLAARSAKFAMAYTAAGLVPDGSSSYFLPRIIGLRRTQELMLTNRRLSAEEAYDWGIVTRVVEDAELETESMTLARRIAEGPTLAFGAVKKLLAGSFECPLETQMEHESIAVADAAVSEDGREGVAAFFAKRPAQYNGR